MNTSVMNLSQQQASPVLQRLSLHAHPHAQSATLRTGRRPTMLMVQKGRAWVTLPGQGGEAARDLWLDAGQCLQLAPHQALWIDGWPQAELQLLPLPQAARGPGVLRGLLAWARRQAQPRPVSDAAVSCCSGA